MSSSIESFEFATASRIVFGCGAVKQVGKITAGFGKRVLLVHDSHCTPSRLDTITTPLRGDPGISNISAFAVSGEPTLETAADGVSAAVACGCDVIVAYGGGSTIDTAKAIGGLVANGGTALDYLEVIGLGKPLAKPALPIVAVPTSAGTGAEVTKNSVLCSRQHGVKASMRADSLLPRVALVDPLLTLTAPQDVVRSSGLDALTQCLEPFVCNKTNPITDALCREGIARAAKSIVAAFDEPSNVPAHEDMCVASLLGGMCLANAKLGLVHGFAGPLGGMLVGAPHGALCAATLPHVIKANVAALRTLPETDRVRSFGLARYAEVARIVTGKPDATPEDCGEWTAALCSRLHVPPLSSFGLDASRIPELVSKVSKASSTKGNIVVLTDAQIEAVARASM